MYQHIRQTNILVKVEKHFHKHLTYADFSFFSKKVTLVCFHKAVIEANTIASE